MSSELDLKTAEYAAIIAALAAWQEEQFGKSSTYEDMLLGCVEEAGELAHATLKAKQKIRGLGNPEVARAKKIDACCDIAIYACQAAGMHGLDPIFPSALDRKAQTGWWMREIADERRMVRYIATLAAEPDLRELACAVQVFVEKFCNADFLIEFKRVVNEVMARNWKGAQ